MSLDEIAREYVSRFGLSVIPVGRDKKPLIEWGEYQKRLPTEEELREWFSKEANIAIITGKVSGLVVIDIDGKEGEETLRKHNLYIPPTACVRTGRGFHYYFKYHNGIKSMRRYQGVDIKGDGGYVLAPPSIHPSGKMYEWIIPLQAGIGSPPDWILNHEVQIVKEEGWVEQALQGVEEGIRNDTLARLAGHFFGKGLGLQEVFIILSDWNKKNKPPLPEEELIKTIQSIYKRETEKREVINLISQDEKKEIKEIPFISRYINIASKFTDAPEDYHLASILGILSTAVGPNVSSPILTGLTRPLRCSLYILLLGESSLYRKSTALYLALSTLADIPDCYSDIEEKRYGVIIPNSFSPEALLHILTSRTGPSLLARDEIAGFFKSFSRQYMAGLKEDLIKLYDGDRLERLTLTGGFLQVNIPYLSILSATTPSSFTEVFKESDIQSGLLPRFLIAYPDKHGTGKRIDFISRTEKEDKDLASLKEDIKNIYTYWKTNNAIYYLTDKGLDRFNEFVNKTEMMIEEEPNIDKFLARVPWTVYKIAMILQAVDDALKGIISETIKDEYLIASIGIMDRFLPQTIKAFEMIGESEVDVTIRKILGYLTTPKKKSEIMRKFHLTSRQAEEIKRTMLERDLIEIEDITRGGEVWRIR